GSPVAAAASEPPRVRARSLEETGEPGPSPADEIATLPESGPADPAPRPSAIGREPVAQPSAGIVEVGVGEPERALGAPSPELENDEFDRAFDASFAPETEEIAPSTWAPPAPAEHVAPGSGAFEPAASVTAHEAPEPARPGRVVSAEAMEQGSPRRALVAEDSITARVFLARMLEQRGFEVDAVDSAASLHAALAHGRHDLACVDVELPDDGGEPFLTRLAGDVAGRGLVLVALVRDADDADAARRAGVHRTLGKPFDDRALDELLARLGFERA
ncbi:MAG TPA: response regulator, partial [Candidatus Eisenbacteria bacterium]|nr:response regulator [Candidatus Eisenbacteria bacterium]